VALMVSCGLTGGGVPKCGERGRRRKRSTVVDGRGLFLVLDYDDSHYVYWECIIHMDLMYVCRIVVM